MSQENEVPRAYCEAIVGLETLALQGDLEAAAMLVCMVAPKVFKVDGSFDPVAVLERALKVDAYEQKEIPEKRKTREPRSIPIRVGVK